VKTQFRVLSQSHVLVSSMIKAKLFTLLAGVVVFLATGISAQAEVQTLAVAVDESQILQLPAQPGAIIIGNPSIADVSIQGQKLFVHGRSFGETNLIILDLQGNQIASFQLVGQLAQSASGRRQGLYRTD
jgi:Flp pilus assembly secretin CpaC